MRRSIFLCLTVLTFLAIPLRAQSRYDGRPFMETTLTNGFLKARNRDEFEKICRRNIEIFFRQPNYYKIDGIGGVEQASDAVHQVFSTP